jgi:hypothetical protein
VPQGTWGLLWERIVWAYWVLMEFPISPCAVLGLLAHILRDGLLCARAAEGNVRGLRNEAAARLLGDHHLLVSAWPALLVLHAPGSLPWAFRGALAHLGLPAAARATACRVRSSILRTSK